MQIKTIQKTIQNKLNEWLLSISDENLRLEVKNNILVSGGAITSMLLNQPVNDYDIYIKEKDVLVKLVLYYTKGYNITVFKGWEKEKLLEPYNKGILAGDEDYSNSYIIAVRNLKEGQVKLFMPNSAGIRVNEQASEQEKLKYIPQYFSPNAISLSNQLQIVTRFSGDNVEIHKTFDFIHATNYFTFSDGLVTNKEALECILTKQLKYQGSQYPLTSIIRMKKFIKRDWNINAGEILKIMFQISELNLKDPNVLEEQLVGVDVAYFGKMIEILRGVKDKEIDSHFLNTVIDRVFSGAEEAE